MVIADIDADAGEAAAAALGDVGAFKQTDVTDADSVQAAVDFTVERFGGLHVMSNNAGVASAMVRFLHDDLSDFTGWSTSTSSASCSAPSAPPAT